MLLRLSMMQIHKEPSFSEVFLILQKAFCNDNKRLSRSKAEYLFKFDLCAISHVTLDFMATENVISSYAITCRNPIIGQIGPLIHSRVK